VGVKVIHVLYFPQNTYTGRTLQDVNSFSHEEIMSVQIKLIRLRIQISEGGRGTARGDNGGSSHGTPTYEQGIAI
jgi:hypothetical protein